MRIDYSTINFKKLKAWLIKESKKSTLVLHWSRGGDEGYVESNIFSMDGFDDILVNLMYEKIDEYGYTGNFSASGSAVYDPETNSFEGTDYCTDYDGIGEKECDIELRLPASIQWKSVYIDISQNEGEELEVDIRFHEEQAAERSELANIATSWKDKIFSSHQEIFGSVTEGINTTYTSLKLERSTFKVEDGDLIYHINELRYHEDMNEESEIILDLEDIFDTYAPEITIEAEEVIEWCDEQSRNSPLILSWERKEKEVTAELNSDSLKGYEKALVEMVIDFFEKEEQANNIFTYGEASYDSVTKKFIGADHFSRVKEGKIHHPIEIQVPKGIKWDLLNIYIEDHLAKVNFVDLKGVILDSLSPFAVSLEKTIMKQLEGVFSNILNLYSSQNSFSLKKSRFITRDDELVLTLPELTYLAKWDFEDNEIEFDLEGFEFIYRDYPN